MAQRGIQKPSLFVTHIFQDANHYQKTLQLFSFDIEKAFNPYKIGPFGEPIKNGLLGRFPTLRKDDGEVKSSRPPPPPPPVQ
jgi:hypothetical protein